MWGHSLQKRDDRGTSVFSPIATELRTSRHVRNVPKAEFKLAQVEGMMHKALQIKIKGRWY
jgi:hypothetical protein